MKWLDSMISKIDAITLRPASELDQREKEFIDEANQRGNAINRSVNEAYDSVDTKSAAILQHVSIMIAVSGVLYSKATSKIFEIVFILEMLIYILLALLCLRLLMTQHFSPLYADTRNVVAKESLVDQAAKLTYLISIVLIATVLVEVVFT